MAAKAATPPGLVTVRYVAEACHCSPSTVYRWLDAGSVSGARIGGTRFVELASLVIWLGADVATRLGLLDAEDT